MVALAKDRKMSARLIIACLSQKGGVGKSTLARLIATEFATQHWKVKIADLNLKQKTSVDWAATREMNGVEPAVEAQAFGTVKTALAQEYDLIVFDGKPESEGETLAAAKASDLIIIPTGTSYDDLGPQIGLAEEMIPRGIEKKRILFVINKTTGSEANFAFAKNAITVRGFNMADTDIPMKTSYEQAQNLGRSISETTYGKLNERASYLAAEIAKRAVELLGARAA